jgi:hypothetical protein
MNTPKISRIETETKTTTKEYHVCAICDREVEATFSVTDLTLCEVCGRYVCDRCLANGGDIADFQSSYVDAFELPLEYEMCKKCWEASGEIREKIEAKVRELERQLCDLVEKWIETMKQSE